MQQAANGFFSTYKTSRKKEKKKSDINNWTGFTGVAAIGWLLVSTIAAT